MMHLDNLIKVFTIIFKNKTEKEVNAFFKRNIFFVFSFLNIIKRNHFFKEKVKFPFKQLQRSSFSS